MAEIFSAPDYDCRLEGSHEKPDFAVTRLRSGPRPAEKAPAYPADDALLVCVSLTPTAIGQWRARYKGREVGVTRAIPFATTVLDLLCSMEMWVRGPFDYLHYYLSAPLLKRIALDNGVAPSYELREASVHQHLIRLRIERAKRLLSQANKQLVEIAQLSGFCDQAAFTRTFTRVERMTPSRWRKCNSG